MDKNIKDLIAKRNEEKRMATIGRFVVAEVNHLKNVSETHGVTIECDNFFGDEVKVTPVHMIVTRYHKGIKYPNGAVSYVPLYTHVSESEDVLLNALDVQSGETRFTGAQSFVPHGPFESMMAHINKGLGRILPDLGVDAQWFVKQCENFTIIHTFSKKCDTIGEYYALAQMSYRLFTGKVLSTEVDKIIARVFITEVQAYDVGDVLRTLREAFDGVTTVSESPLVKKLTSLYSYLLVQGFLKRFDITLSDEDYSKMEQRALLSAFSSKKGFYVHVIDTVLFICERIYEYRITGDITSFVHTSGKYAEWLKEADRVINLAPFTGNLSAHGTSYFSYIADLRDLCEKGAAYAKYVQSSSGVDPVLIKRKLNTLQLLSNTEITRRAAMQERAQPMGVLVYGHSSIAKSSFTKMLFNYYGALFDLERGDDFRYVRNPTDEYWSNFDTSKWCIQLDDIAFRHPSKCADIDPTLNDLLNVVNNVPYVPPQAALEDKGKTPVMAELVIATTNCEALNAQEYFWCPLAVRRRLPYVIELTPKDEYKHANQHFIDPTKIVIEDGKFPDLWDIVVKRIHPVVENDREMAQLVVDRVFSSTNEFLAHFGRACKQHKENQAKAMGSDKNMSTVSVCKKCCMPLPHETCLEVQSLDTTWFMSGLLLNSILNWVFGYAIFWKILERLSTFRWMNRITFGIVNRLTCDTRVMNFYGKYVDFTQRHGAQARKIVGLLSVIIGAYFAYRAMPSFKTPKIRVPVKEEEEVVEEMDVQGNVYGTTEDQLEKEERSNVWYNPMIELTTFDVPKASTSLVGATPEKIRDMFARNCVYLRIRVVGGDATRHMRAVFIKGHKCLTNAHAFRSDGDEFTVELIQSSPVPGVSANITFNIKRRDIAFSGDSDFCLFEVLCVPPFKDITPFWCTEPINPTQAIVVTREDDGTVGKRFIYAMASRQIMPVEELQKAFPVHMGLMDCDSFQGLCGSLYVATTPRGPVIIGIHFLGKDRRVGALSIRKFELDKLLKSPQLVQRPTIQCGDAPNMTCNRGTRMLGPLHHKSVFRYIEKGTARIYGTFQGFRSKMKSSVTATPFQKEMLEHYATEVGYDKPMMNGWQPWRNNVVEMVRPVVNYDRQMMQKAKDAFTKDILRELPEGWQKELVELSDRAAVNGLPGVKFIDRIAVSTSMGFPWNTTKKSYLHSAPTEEQPDGVDFDDDFWKRVRDIEARYARGERANPIFMGTLKDEATPFRKCRIGKTRLFTGNPTDWAVMARKKLLPFVRLVQKNKFVFEAGPGTVCQSAEWGQIYDYMTIFGTDRMIAGDYGKYDKHMISDLILYAFWIICDIYEAAGFGDDFIQQICAIAEDIAFPHCNVNGDLVEFFGTNPSGHPFTVIINSLVNSLYMRYCYVVLNPEHECESFRTNVHLFTYGDDNMANVSRRAKWFNHTDIQRTLADIGVEYTMADKEAESVPFIDIKDVSFLKRRFRWSEDVQNWLCPLEEESIIKSLTVWVPSKSIDKYQQMVSVISAACCEYFFYGREKFEEKRTFFKALVEQEPYSHYVLDSTLPTYDQLVERFHRASDAK